MGNSKNVNRITSITLLLFTPIIAPQWEAIGQLESV